MTRTVALLTITLSLTISATRAQSRTQRDSLRQLLLTLPNDTNRAMTLGYLAFEFYQTKPDTTYLMGQQAYELARQLNYPRGQAMGLNYMGLAMNFLGDYPKAIRLFDQAKALFAQIGDRQRVAVVLNNTADLYMKQGQWTKALATMQQCYALYQTLPSPRPRHRPIYLANIGECYLNLHRLDSAQYYLGQALPLAKRANPAIVGALLYDLGDVALARRQYRAAYDYYRQSLSASALEQAHLLTYEASYRLANLFAQTGPPDSTRYYAQQALAYAQRGSYLQGVLNSSQRLATLYKGQNDRRALAYYEIAVAAKDSLFSQEKVKQLLTLDFEEQQKAREIEVAQEAYRSRIRQYVLGGFLALLVGVALLLYRNNRQKQRANTLLQEQRDQITTQRGQLEHSLQTLQTTQAQLIQKEKLASLGELTAGIAHELQNPLNFVNNFSEVSAELVGELEDEQQKPARDPQLEAELIGDLKQNLQKITHHGHRASSIVRGMLEHSRTSTGERQPTDLNALADEYLRMAYQRQLAKDKTINVELKTDFAPGLDEVEVIPQEIGRVLLNLFNNAFYAVSQKQKTALPDYQPTVMVSTRRSDSGVNIRVWDNGTGIPESVKSKIFQPFFTTKPTGEGTGLGLSLSYDIITGGHGGTLTVTSQAGTGSTFTIHLPYKTSV